ncbi:Bacteriophage CI repressor helix-turn-helix domain protein [Vibrio aerogenes CECT 7868]|uniref:Bacteriophage CI repressor helix-turn-helix domain protein n=1 Tax=Vibrio aerogenes CECT 7868 TaxID=1216006 RepID=A0A1M5VVJ2_9VIBR|nr:helix-turn-helix domain-containing protein [Vibrio aerogenes]SHH79282.1 Bacteriophage CI repressor helix-turn-helix domain protein [Vibrio aerogenes CECT 7868]
MNEQQDKIHPKAYIKGHDVTKRLKEVTNCHTILELSSLLNISSSTISTWHQRELTPYEVILRVHLHTGAALEYLLLGKGEPYPEKSSQYEQNMDIKNKKIANIEHFQLINGELFRCKRLIFDHDYLYKLEVTQPLSIEYRNTIYVIDRSVTQIVAGMYLIDMEDFYSLNTIQRLPGRRCSIDVLGSTLQIHEDDIKVIGKVILEINKK